MPLLGGRSANWSAIMSSNSTYLISPFFITRCYYRAGRSAKFEHTLRFMLCFTEVLSFMRKTNEKIWCCHFCQFLLSRWHSTGNPTASSSIKPYVQTLRRWSYLLNTGEKYGPTIDLHDTRAKLASVPSTGIWFLLPLDSRPAFLASNY